MTIEKNEIVFANAEELADFVSERSRVAATNAAISIVPMMLRHIATALSGSSTSSDSQDTDRIAAEVIAKIAAGIIDFADEFEKNPASTSTIMAGEADS